MGEKIVKGEVVVKLAGLGNTKKGYQLCVSDEGIVLTQVDIPGVLPFRCLEFLFLCFFFLCLGGSWSLGQGVAFILDMLSLVHELRLGC